MNRPPIVALEIGTTRTRALVGEVVEDGHLMITGVGECPSRGVRKGEVFHFENALAGVRSALHIAERNGRLTITHVHLLVTGAHIQSLVNRGQVPVEDPESGITAADIEHARDTARAVRAHACALARELGHLLARASDDIGHAIHRVSAPSPAHLYLDDVRRAISDGAALVGRLLALEDRDASPGTDPK